MTWKTAYRSFYYDGAPEPADPILRKGKVALLVIDVQNTYLDRPDPATIQGDALKRYHAWTPFHERMHTIVLPNLQRLIARFREGGLDVSVRAHRLPPQGRARSFAQSAEARLERSAAPQRRARLPDPQVHRADRRRDRGDEDHR